LLKKNKSRLDRTFVIADTLDAKRPERDKEATSQPLALATGSQRVSSPVDFRRVMGQREKRKTC